MIEAVIFDHDGVIIDNQPYQGAAWTELFRENGINISEEDISTKIRGRPTLVGLKNFFEDKYTEDQLKELARRKEELYISFFLKDFKEVSGFSKFARKLHDLRIPMAIATSTTLDLLNITLDKLQLQGLFQVIVSSEDISESKPSPQIYLVTAERLGVTPDKCAIFEDSKSGIESAVAAGSKVILVTTSHKPNELNISGINLTIPDFSSLSPQQVLTL
ncbi:MAG: HAD-superfamily hydrolase, subfamily IA, variant 3 [uncultured bacterium]|uniref:HAD-superfamily hydrolase, subfamily IA, variant 3 n=4 Tax=Candidatus Daviesiibacteriota TaxID=1752718 RepID=A0A0G0I005_9BACT|nr:MAG: HAD-superfamily hydrolase, subfamily IA, variant 3 [uncultured bacterium]KKQ09441.1 MAG: HAD-superfamily hydrolase, subfamily IA, variant 3 [Candidatus Daviesbacteria bacterium GW2011_GWB1_36_5]KKQ14925.1 MAG: HAD-superfamily hydrolase, subfamily IA, variant 3 [Candidatus Daviesbacteria bacterium GW2011_GWA1_36_8]OGE17238.1 MAG: hypothetical protein A2858_00855 [Candidatus Daviesbacteria bacterium RIFCSPHIGHO2_01_FULL_36_37]OGE36019.1 MAG: hypothetical protein A3E66_01850 [Candidatus Da